MTSAPPLISAILPVYNGAAFVAAAIASVLGQTYAPLELIVVDDGSTDESAAIVQGFGDKLTCIHQLNRGPAAVRNAGLQIAHGAIIAFLDADDLWPAGKLACQQERLAADGTLDVVLGHTQFMHQASCLDVTKNDENSRFASPLASRPPQFSEQEEVGTGETVTLINEPVPQYFLGSALFRRSVFATVGGFDETLRYCDDWDWFLRGQELGVAMQMFQEVALCYRRHQNNLTRSPDSRRELLTLLRKALARRREQGGGEFALPAWFDIARRVNGNG